MAPGTRKQRERQESLWIVKQEMPASAAHPFYERRNALLEPETFDAFAEPACQRYYAEPMGRPGLTPGIYFRCLLGGYFEGIDAERGIGWDERGRDHSTISRTRRLKGQTVGVDATSLEANAAMRSSVRRESGGSYQEFPTGLAKEPGSETPAREQLAKLNRKRK